MAVLAVAGTAKLLDLPGFLVAVAEWQLIPRAFVLPLTLIVPTAEVFCGGLWLAGWHWRWTPYIALAMLSSFVGLVGAHVAFGMPPQCGCFGVIDAYFRHLDAGILAGAKSGGLLAACALGILLDRGSSREERS